MPDGTMPESFTGAEILAAQRAAFLDAGAPNLQNRRNALKRLAKAIAANRQRFQDAAMADFGNRAPEETALIDLGSSHVRIEIAIRAFFLAPRHVYVEAKWNVFHARILSR